MSWLRTDDGFPEHPKSDALAEHFGDDWSTCAVAFMAWHHMGCDCASRLTDGVFNAARVYRVVRAPREVIDRALAGLVAVRFLEAVAGGFAFHDWHHYQPTAAEVSTKREEVSRKRAEAGRKGGLKSGEKRGVGSKQNEANGKQTGEANPSKPEANGEANPTANALPEGDRSKPEANGGSKPEAPSRPDPSPSEGSKEPLSPVPPAPTTPPLELTPPEAPKAAKAKCPKPAKPSVLPFSVVEALNAIASTSGGRFVPGDRSTWTKGWNIALAAYVKRFPDLALWRRVGAHVAAGGGWAKQTLGPEWAASDGFVAVVNLLPDWERRGSQVVDARFAVVVKAPPVAPPTASQPHAPKKVFLGEEFAAAAKAAREGK